MPIITTFPFLLGGVSQFQVNHGFFSPSATKLFGYLTFPVCCNSDHRPGSLEGLPMGKRDEKVRTGNQMV